MTGSRFEPTRRQYLCTIGALSIAGVAGCSGSPSGNGGEDTTDEASDGSDATPADDTSTPESASGDSGSMEVTPWRTLHANPERTRSTPDPVPQELTEVASVDAGDFAPRAASTPTPLVTGEGVFLLGPEAMGRFGVSPLEQQFKKEFGRNADSGRGTIPGYVDGSTLIAGVEDTLLGLSVADGTRKWIAEATGVPFPAGEGIGIVDKVNLRVLETDSREVRWKQESAGFGDGWVPKPPVVHVESGMVFVADDTDIFAFDLASGEQQWSLTREEPTPVAVHGDTLYVVDTDGVVAVNRSDGSMQWSQLGTAGVAKGVTGNVPSYAVDEDGVYFVGERIVALDPSDGTELWSTPSTAAVFNLAAGDGGLVYNTDGGLRVISKTNGESQASADAATVGGISLAGGRIYGWKDGTPRNKLIALGSG